MYVYVFSHGLKNQLTFYIGYILAKGRLCMSYKVGFMFNVFGNV